jgi:hypothetical protein
MSRREFIARLGGATLLWPFAVHAQQVERVPHVGVM